MACKNISLWKGDTEPCKPCVNDNFNMCAKGRRFQIRGSTEDDKAGVIIFTVVPGTSDQFSAIMVQDDGDKKLNTMERLFSLFHIIGEPTKKGGVEIQPWVMSQVNGRFGGANWLNTRSKHEIYYLDEKREDKCRRESDVNSRLSTGCDNIEGTSGWKYWEPIKDKRDGSIGTGCGGLAKQHLYMCWKHKIEGWKMYEWLYTSNTYYNNAPTDVDPYKIYLHSKPGACSLSGGNNVMITTANKNASLVMYLHTFNKRVSKGWADLCNGPVQNSGGLINSAMAFCQKYNDRNVSKVLWSPWCERDLLYFFDLKEYDSGVPEKPLGTLGQLPEQICDKLIWSRRAAKPVPKLPGRFEITKDHAPTLKGSFIKPVLAGYGNKHLPELNVGFQDDISWTGVQKIAQITLNKLRNGDYKGYLDDMGSTKKNFEHIFLSIFGTRDEVWILAYLDADQARPILEGKDGLKFLPTRVYPREGGDGSKELPPKDFRADEFITLRFDRTDASGAVYGDKSNRWVCWQPLIDGPHCARNNITIPEKVTDYCTARASKDSTILGQACVADYNNFGSNLSSRDSHIESYCTANKASTDCQCAARMNFPTFTTLLKSSVVVGTGRTSEPDACWWRPCKVGDVSMFIKKSDDVASCTASLCLSAIDITESTNINLDDVRQIALCEGEKLPDDLGSGSPPSTPSTPTSPPPLGSDEPGSKEGGVNFVLIIVVFIMVLVLGAGAYFLFSRGSSSSTVGTNATEVTTPTGKAPAPPAKAPVPPAKAPVPPAKAPVPPAIPTR